MAIAASKVDGTADVQDGLHPRERRRREVGTRTAVVDCVIELLDKHGEQGLRVADVTRRTGVSIGSIYHHFGDRDGLIKAARSAQFCASTSTFGVRVAELVVRSNSVPEFVAGLRELNRDAHSRTHDRERLQRCVYVASALSRPDLLAELRTQQTEMIGAGTDIAQLLIDRGWVRDGVSAHAFATFVLALEFGGVVAALDERRITDDAWCDVVQRATEGLLRVAPDDTLD